MVVLYKNMILMSRHQKYDLMSRHQKYDLNV